MPNPSPDHLDTGSERQTENKEGDRQGQTMPAQGETETQDKVPRLPHERDESADSQQATKEPTTKKMGELAQADLERGLVDTDRRPVLDAAYEKAKK